VKAKFLQRHYRVIKYRRLPEALSLVAINARKFSHIPIHHNIIYTAKRNGSTKIETLNFFTDCPIM